MNLSDALSVLPLVGSRSGNRRKPEDGLYELSEHVNAGRLLLLLWLSPSFALEVVVVVRKSFLNDYDIVFCGVCVCHDL